MNNARKNCEKNDFCLKVFSLNCAGKNELPTEWMLTNKNNSGTTPIIDVYFNYINTLITKAETNGLTDNEKKSFKSKEKNNQQENTLKNIKEQLKKIYDDRPWCSYIDGYVITDLKGDIYNFENKSKENNQISNDDKFRNYILQRIILSIITSNTIKDSNWNRGFKDEKCKDINDFRTQLITNLELDKSFISKILDKFLILYFLFNEDLELNVNDFTRIKSKENISEFLIKILNKLKNVSNKSNGSKKKKTSKNY